VRRGAGAGSARLLRVRVLRYGRGTLLSRSTAARTRVDLAGVRAKRGDELAARQHLHLAIATFETAGAPKRVAEASDLARALGITLA